MATECYLAATDDIDDAMDALAVPIEDILENTLLNNLAFDISLQATTFEIDSTGEVPIAVLTMVWQVLYRTLEGQPEVAV